ncbi:trehalose-phosphatase [Actinotalea sp. C106]|uniref:trehalose-phosphatase n=1 Tax=Actinotalea sp. C106 TaxID=2908644 RepID=UPI00202804E2|nr:trehalose-phosphatase [Actinotalea sp. C106]
MTAPTAGFPTRELVARLHAGDRVLLALDFDGTLAPLVDDPDASRALPEAVVALDRLGGATGLELALVSGRHLDDLSRLADVPDGTWLVGSHGAERGRRVAGALERVDLELPAEAAALRTEIGDDLDAAVGTVGGARVEHKPASVVLHTRTATPADAARLTELALALGEREGVDAMHGKDVVELSVLDVTKGHALADLRTELEVAVVVYVGDDVTDERAFVTLGEQDVTVKVGPGETAARHRTESPESLAEALGELATGLDLG